MSARYVITRTLSLCALVVAAACTSQPTATPTPPPTTTALPISIPSPIPTDTQIPLPTNTPALQAITPTGASASQADQVIQRHLEQAIASLADCRTGLAVAHLDQALAERPDWTDGYLYRGIALTANRYVDEAVADFDRVIAAQPRRAEAYYLRAFARQLFATQPSLDPIRKDVSKALELDPDLADARALQATLDMVTAAQSAKSNPAKAIESIVAAQSDLRATRAFDPGAEEGYAIVMDLAAAQVLASDRARLEAQLAEADVEQQGTARAFAAYARSGVIHMLLASAQSPEAGAMQKARRDLVKAIELGHARVQELAAPGASPLQMSRILSIQGSLTVPVILLDRSGYGGAPGSYAGDPSYPTYIKMIQAYGEHRIIFLSLFYDRPLVFAVDVSPDGKQIAALADNGPSFLTLWDMTSGKKLREVKLEPKKSVAPQGSIDFSSDSKQIVVTYLSPEVPIVNSQTGKTLKTLVHSEDVHFARFSPDGSRVVTVDSAGTVRLWDVAAGKETMKLSPESGTTVSSAVFSPDGRQVIGGGDRVQIWDAATGERLTSFPGYNPRWKSETGIAQPSLAILGNALPYYLDIVNFPAVSSDGNLLALPGSQPRIVDAKTGKNLLALVGHRDGVRSITFSPDGNQVATASWDGTARIWQVKTGKQLVLTGHIGIVVSVAFSPDGHLLVTGGSDGTVRVWDSITGEEAWSGLAIPPLLDTTEARPTPTH